MLPPMGAGWLESPSLDPLHACVHVAGTRQGLELAARVGTHAQSVLGRKQASACERHV
jgi:hypothetical protein